MFKKFSFLLNFKKHFLFSLISFLIAVSLAISFLVLFPNQVFANEPAQISLDGSITFEIWGLFDKGSIKIESLPKTNFKIQIEKDYFFKKTIKVSPSSLLSPSSQVTLKLSLKNWFGKASNKTIDLETSSLPKVVKVTPNPGTASIPTTSKLEFELDSSFKETNSYLFTSEPKFAYDQKTLGNKIAIIPKNKLKQGETYNISLSLTSENFKPALLYQGSFNVIKPVEIISLDPAENSLQVLKQTSLNLVFNKPIFKKSFEENFEISPKVLGNFSWPQSTSVKFTPTNPLQTSTTYTVTLKNLLTAEDGSELDQSKIYTFTTAGPVKLASFSPSGAYFPVNSSIVMNFDQPVETISAQQNFSIAPVVGGSFSYSDKTLVFHPSSLNLLTNYTVHISKGIKTVGGEDSQQDFSFSFTTTSERVTTYGFSVQGRALKAYYFGTGSKKILLVGALHGNESNTSSMLNQWISFMRANQTSIGSDRTFIIIPYANPDGSATGNRFNARGVDLNRNWDLPDWQALTYWQNNSYPSGGGSSPFSEPETRSLSNLIIAENPTRIITYHSAANVVIGGGSSNSFATWYSGLTGYNLSTSNGEDDTSCQSVVGYCVTGTLEEWAGKRGNQTIVVEFSTMYSSEYSKNLPALKGLLALAI